MPIGAQIGGYQHFTKAEAITAARELLYGRDVIEKIKKANSAEEISRIMNSARNAQTQRELDARSAYIASRRGK